MGVLYLQVCFIARCGVKVALLLLPLLYVICWAIDLSRYRILQQLLQADDSDMHRLVRSWPAHLVRDPNHMVANLKILSDQMSVPRVGSRQRMFSLGVQPHVSLMSTVLMVICCSASGTCWLLAVICSLVCQLMLSMSACK